MKKSRFSEEQMLPSCATPTKARSWKLRAITRKANRRFTPGARGMGRSSRPDVKRLRSLEAKNAKRKRMLAEREMAIDTLKEINRPKW